MRGIILYGPPASGKDTITLALTAADPRCEVFRRLKSGSGKTSTYRMVTEQYLEELRVRGALAWENDRYGATYAIDTPGLHEHLHRGVPVIHLGQVEAVAAVKAAAPEATWLVVELWCPRDVADARLRAREPSGAAERLRVWESTPRLPSRDVEIDTGRVEPTEAASLILKRLRALVPGGS
jgi:guanylate kinase